jgi:hypothetical protein
MNKNSQLLIEDGAIKLASRNIFLRNITSTRIQALPPKQALNPGDILLLLAIIFVASGAVSIAVVMNLYVFYGIAIIVIMGGGYISKTKFPRKITQLYSLMVVSSAGEVTVLSDLSKESAIAYSDEIARAIGAQ